MLSFTALVFETGGLLKSSWQAKPRNRPSPNTSADMLNPNDRCSTLIRFNRETAFHRYFSVNFIRAYIRSQRGCTSHNCFLRRLASVHRMRYPKFRSYFARAQRTCAKAKSQTLKPIPQGNKGLRCGFRLRLQTCSAPQHSRSAPCARFACYRRRIDHLLRQG